jgi:hypothetical protein
MRMRLLVVLAACLAVGAAPRGNLGEVWGFPPRSIWAAVRGGATEGHAWALGTASWVYREGGRVPWPIRQASAVFKEGNKVEVRWSCGPADAPYIRAKAVRVFRLDPGTPGQAHLKGGGSLRLVGRRLQLDMPAEPGPPGMPPARLSFRLERAK